MSRNQTHAAEQAYDDARHALTAAIDAPRGPVVGLPGHTAYNRLTAMVNEYRDAFMHYRDMLDGEDEMRLQADFADIHARAAQKLLDLSPYDLPPEE